MSTDSTNTQPENELYHYGVRGMKWYQHLFGKDDSRAKYAKGSRSRESKIDRKIKSLSDEDLRRAIDRLRMEQDYRNLSQTKKSKGKQIVSDILASSGKAFLTNFSSEYGKVVARRLEQKQREDLAGQKKKSGAKTKN